MVTPTGVEIVIVAREVIEFVNGLPADATLPLEDARCQVYGAALRLFNDPSKSYFSFEGAVVDALKADPETAASLACFYGLN
jgi:hypothetical protein